MFRRKIVGFVSEIDKFLNEFNKSHKNSPAQAAEISKYEKVYEQRDNPEFEDKQDII